MEQVSCLSLEVCIAIVVVVVIVLAAVVVAATAADVDLIFVDIVVVAVVTVVAVVFVAAAVPAIVSVADTTVDNNLTVNDWKESNMVSQKILLLVIFFGANREKYQIKIISPLRIVNLLDCCVTKKDLTLDCIRTKIIN